ncbi:hypothetical protein M3Y96_00561700 [Aphelenchoides besseyi]|nr:hypothetical protein M3Y96_00561700 [Aphelenchoides besseyi]
MTTFERLEAERQAAEVDAAKVNHPKYVDVGTGKRRPNGYYVKNEITGRYHCAEHPSNLTIGNCVSWFTMACSLITHQRYGGRCKTPHDNINDVCDDFFAHIFGKDLVQNSLDRKWHCKEQKPKFDQLPDCKHAFKKIDDLKLHLHKSPSSCKSHVPVKMIQRTDNRYYCKDNAALRGFDVSCNSSFKHSGNLRHHYRQQRCYPPEVRLEKYIAHFRQQIDDSGFSDSSELLDQYMAVYKKYKQVSTADRRSSNLVNDDDIRLKLLMDNLNNQKIIDGSHSLVQKCRLDAQQFDENISDDLIKLSIILSSPKPSWSNYKFANEIRSTDTSLMFTFLAKLKSNSKNGQIYTMLVASPNLSSMSKTDFFFAFKTGYVGLSIQSNLNRFWDYHNVREHSKIYVELGRQLKAGTANSLNTHLGSLLGIHGALNQGERRLVAKFFIDRFYDVYASKNYRIIDNNLSVLNGNGNSVSRSSYILSTLFLAPQSPNSKTAKVQPNYENVDIELNIDDLATLDVDEDDCESDYLDDDKMTGKTRRRRQGSRGPAFSVVE